MSARRFQPPWLLFDISNSSKRVSHRFSSLARWLRWYSVCNGHRVPSLRFAVRPARTLRTLYSLTERSGCATAPGVSSVSRGRTSAANGAAAADFSVGRQEFPPSARAAKFFAGATVEFLCRTLACNEAMTYKNQRSGGLLGGKFCVTGATYEIFCSLCDPVGAPGLREIDHIYILCRVSGPGFVLPRGRTGMLEVCNEVHFRWKRLGWFW